MEFDELNLTEQCYRLIRCYYVYGVWSIHKAEDYEQLIEGGYALMNNGKYYVMNTHPAHRDGVFTEFTKEQFYSTYTFSEQKAKNKAKQKAESYFRPYKAKVDWVLKKKEFDITIEAIEHICGWYVSTSHIIGVSVKGKKYKCNIEYYKDMKAKKHNRWKKVYIVKDDAHYSDKIYEQSFNEKSFKKHFKIIEK